MVKRVILSLDYDGCSWVLTPEGLYSEAARTNNKFFFDETDKGSAYERRVQLGIAVDKYNRYLTEITTGAANVSVYVGSDRQSKNTDDHNSLNNKNGSVFPAMREICRNRTDFNPSCEWKFEPYLIADGYNPKDEKSDIKLRGSALGKIEDKKFTGKHPAAPVSTVFMEGTGKPSKAPMIINQMWDAYKQYPRDELEFHFIDDREDIIEDVLKKIKPSDLPPGMTLKVSRSSYIHELHRSLASTKDAVTTQPLSVDFLIKDPSSLNGTIGLVSEIKASLKVSEATSDSEIGAANHQVTTPSSAR